MGSDSLWSRIRGWYYRHFSRYCGDPACPRSIGIGSPTYIYAHYHRTWWH